MILEQLTEVVASHVQVSTIYIEVPSFERFIWNLFSSCYGYRKRGLVLGYFHEYPHKKRKIYSSGSRRRGEYRFRNRSPKNRVNFNSYVVITMSGSSTRSRGFVGVAGSRGTPLRVTSTRWGHTEMERVFLSFFKLADHWVRAFKIGKESI